METLIIGIMVFGGCILVGFMMNGIPWLRDYKKYGKKKSDENKRK